MDSEPGIVVPPDFGDAECREEDEWVDRASGHLDFNDEVRGWVDSGGDLVVASNVERVLNVVGLVGFDGK